MDEPAAGGDLGDRRWRRWLLGAALALWLVYALPAALGLETFYVRDVFSNNFPQKAFGAEQLRQGKIPALNPDWALGQPFRGNPSTLAYYPGNLLYLLLPFWSAFNLHFVLHWLLALFTMRRLARALGQPPLAALLAGITYAGCGWTLSTLTFYNLIVVAAWWPLVMALAVEGGRRGIAWGGVVCGLALLGGEPITALLGLVPLLIATLPRHGLKRSLGIGFAIGLLGLLVALPQIVATARILPFSFRGAHGNFVQLVSTYSLPLPRLAELVLPLPFGWPHVRGDLAGYFAAISQRLPFFISLYFGAVGLALALAARRRGWQALAVTSVTLAWGAGRYSELLDAISFGVFRYPEKFLFWFALAAPLLAGWGWVRITESPPRWWSRALAAAGALSLGLGLTAWLLRLWILPKMAAAAVDPPPANDPVSLASTQLLLQGTYLVVAAVLLLACRWCALHGRPGAVVACQLAALVQLFPLIQTDSTSHYAPRTAWEDRLGEGAAVFNTFMAAPRWHETPPYAAAASGPRYLLQRQMAQDLQPTPGALHGLSFPLAPNIEGLNSPYCTLLEINLARLRWSSRMSWFRVLGLDAMVTYLEPVEIEGLALEEVVERLGEKTWLYRVEDPAPEAWWPRSLRSVPGPRDALGWVSFSQDPIGEVAVPTALEHVAGGRILEVVQEPDRIEIEVESAGGMAVIRRAYQPLLEARTEGGEPLLTAPANLLLTAVEVPPGRQRIILEVAQWPEGLASAVALLAGILSLWLPWRWWR